MQPAHLPPDGARILRFNRGPLTAVSVRVDSETLQQIAELSQQLNDPSRGSLLRYLLAEGIKAAKAQLAQAGTPAPRPYPHGDEHSQEGITPEV